MRPALDPDIRHHPKPQELAILKALLGELPPSNPLDALDSLIPHFLPDLHAEYSPWTDGMISTWVRNHTAEKCVEPTH
jgi:hypothetical protein